MAASANDLSVDVLADIFGFLSGAKEIMQRRRVCKKWSEAVKKTIVPLVVFSVDSLEKYNAMNVITRAMPNLQKINIGALGGRHKYSDGEDPDEREAARNDHFTADYTTHDIEIISSFRKLCNLRIETGYMNGRYPFLFNSFPLLQKLSIVNCRYLKWDLEMLAGLPSLKEFVCINNDHLTGNIGNLRVLKGTLEKVTIYNSHYVGVEGNFMDLADFPHLKKLNLLGTAVTGDIRDIGENDFPSLEELDLPTTVYGGRGCQFQHISDGPDLVRAVCLLKRKIPALDIKHWYGKLSDDSPDWYDSADEDDNNTPPFYICLVRAGLRLGYRWETSSDNDPCEVNWLDPEPDRESSNYEEYIAKLQEINDKVQLYRGFHQPPSEEEYQRLIETVSEESDSEESESDD